MPNRWSRRLSFCCRSGTPRDVAVVRPWATEAKSDAKVLRARARRRPAPGHRAQRDACHPPAVQRPLRGDADRGRAPATAAGASLAVTRWREDTTCDDWGSYVFLRDVAQRRSLVGGLPAGGAEPDAYDVSFNEDRAEFIRHDGT